MDPAEQTNAPDEVVQDLIDLLTRCPAFSGVERRRLGPVIRGSSLVYAAAGSQVALPDGPGPRPLVVHRGALMVHDTDGRPVDVVAAEEYHLPAAHEQLTAVDGSLLLLLPATAADLAWSVPPRRNDTGTARRIDLQTTPVGDLMATRLVTAQAEETCRAVAQRMSEHRVSSVVVLGRGAPGIVTDRDLRTRLVAAGRSGEDPVAGIATFDIRTAPATTPAFNALIEMLSNGTHHLPISEGGQLVGMVTSSDLLQLQVHSPLHLRKALDRAGSVAECAAAMAALPDTVRSLRLAGTTTAQIGQVLATVLDRCTTRLIGLTTADLGPAPAPYGWVAFGSQARREGSLTSDQDTGLILADGLDAAAQAWFARLATAVTDGLVRCGYPRCRGGVMASEPAWRTDVDGWRQRFDRWITTPTEASLLGAEIAFDLRTVSGEIHAVEVIAPTIHRASQQGIFLARLAIQAISHAPPLGFLGRLTVDRSGEHAGTFDLKAGALIPIVDLARVHTLARGGPEVATGERLMAAAADHVLSHDLAATLTAGHDLALGLRLDTALEHREAGREPSNRIDPSTLSPLVRSQLKETFKAVQVAQESLQSRYQLVGR